MSFSVQLQPQTVTVKKHDYVSTTTLRSISVLVFQKVDNAIHLINRYLVRVGDFSVDRVS